MWDLDCLLGYVLLVIMGVAYRCGGRCLPFLRFVDLLLFCLWIDLRVVCVVGFAG